MSEYANTDAQHADTDAQHTYANSGLTNANRYCYRDADSHAWVSDGHHPIEQPDGNDW